MILLGILGNHVLMMLLVVGYGILLDFLYYAIYILYIYIDSKIL